MSSLTLDQLAPGESGQIRKVSGRGPVRRRLVDMGLTSGAKIEMVKVSPLGDPIEYKLRGYSLSLRRSEARSIEVDLLKDSAHRHHRHHPPGRMQNLAGCRSGQRLVITHTRGGRKVRGKLNDLGLIPGVQVQVINNEIPGPMIISINDECRLVLGRGMALHVLVKPHLS